MTTKILILGMREHSKTIHLFENVKIALEHMQSSIEPIQVTDMDELIRLQISGVPALLVNEKIISQRKVLSVSELTRIFQRILIERA